MTTSGKAKKHIAFDFKKATHVTLDQYLAVRNGLGSGLSTIVQLSNTEMKYLDLTMKKGWYAKNKDNKYPLEKLQGLVNQVILTDWAPPAMKKRLASAFIG